MVLPLPLRVLASFCLAAGALAVVAPAAGQESVGFAEPDDLSELLAYRLPDWSYRLWTVGGEVHGSGRSIAESGGRRVRNSNVLDLASNYTWRRESEVRAWRITASGDAHLRNAHDGSGSYEHSIRRIEGGIGLAVQHRRAARPGGPWAEFELTTARDHNELRETSAPAAGLGPTKAVNVERYGHESVALRLGLGRVRDVTPVIRARRLGERLRALGRAPLATDAVLRAAGYIARRHGYEFVHDRPDRRFWRDVLEPALAGREPLSPFEILYLMEALQEDVGSRREGLEAYVGAGFFARHWSRPGASGRDEYATLEYGVAWSRNLSLAHQVAVAARGRYVDPRAGTYTEQGDAGLDLEHLWLVADRRQLYTALTVRPRGERFGGGRNRYLDVHLASTFAVYVEDALRLTAGVSLHFEQTDTEPQQFDRHGWSWTYTLGLEYDLARALS